MDYQDENYKTEFIKEIKALINNKQQSSTLTLKIEREITEKFFLNSSQPEKHDNPDLYSELDDTCEGLLSLNSSFLDLYGILVKISDIHKNDPVTICDIGAGYGKLAMIAEIYFPNIHVISVEPVKNRTKALLKLFPHTQIVNTVYDDDVNKLSFDYAFFYFPTGNTLDSILSKLLNKKLKGIIAIESHGDFFPRLSIEKTWLRPKKLLSTSISRHHDEIRLYEVKTCHSPCELKVFYENLKRYEFLRCNGENGTWIEKCQEVEVEFFKEDELFLNCFISHRTYQVSQKNIKEYEFSNNVESDILSIMDLRSVRKKQNGLAVRRIYTSGQIELENGYIISI